MNSIRRMSESRASVSRVPGRVHDAADAVVVVDDEPDIVDLLVLCLADSGIAAAGTTDPLELLAACERGCVSTVVVDLRMPRIDGIELLRAIADSASRPAVVLMSGSDASVLESARQFVETLGLEVRGTLCKPFSPNALAALVQRTSRPPSAPLAEPYSSPDVVLLPERLVDAIETHAQPQRSFVDGRIVGFEALARLRDPSGELVAPDRFLREARRTGRMRELTSVVLDAALHGLHALRAEGLLQSASVNVPADVLAEEGFVAEVLGRLRHHAVPAWALTLEITEDEIVRNDGPTLAALVRLRIAGVGLAIDDFGTGHSTLTQTRSIPATELKLDRSFVVGLEHSQRAHAIVRSVCRMGRELGLRVVAEGIETIEVAALLEAAGCSLGQGYLYGRPVPFPVLASTLSRTNSVGYARVS